MQHLERFASPGTEYSPVSEEKMYSKAVEFRWNITVNVSSLTETRTLTPSRREELKTSFTQWPSVIWKWSQRWNENWTTRLGHLGWHRGPQGRISTDQTTKKLNNFSKSQFFLDTISKAYQEISTVGQSISSRGASQQHGALKPNKS